MRTILKKHVYGLKSKLVNIYIQAYRHTVNLYSYFKYITYNIIEIEIQ